MDCFQRASYRSIQVIPLKSLCDIEHVTTQSLALKLSQTCQGCFCMHLQGHQRDHNASWHRKMMLYCWNRITALIFCCSPCIHLAHVSNKVCVHWLTWVRSGPWIPLWVGERGLYHELYCLNLVLCFHLAPADSLDVPSGFGSSNVALLKKDITCMRI